MDAAYRCWGKRTLDLVASGAALFLLAPVIAAVAVLVRLLLGAPILFRQMRPGLHAKPFRLRKFRTMAGVRDAEGNELPDAERLTRFGLFLRSSSLDELPEFWNVLRGEMSVVGPRPLLIQYLDRYTPEQARRHDVRPGITGWAQINGRNALTWEEKFKLDAWYVDHVSAILDARIILETFARIVRREGISSDTHATMNEFQGTTRGERADTP